MSVDLNGTNQYGELSSAVVSGTPLTLVAWTYRHTASGDASAIAIEEDGGTTNSFTCRLRSARSVRATSRDSGGQASATTSTVATLNQWEHVATVFASSTSRTAYLNGGGSGTDSTSNTPASLDITRIGTGENFLWYYDGLIAEVAVYNKALTTGELTDLQTKSPILVAAANLVSYWPLGGPNYSDNWDDQEGSNNMTANGSPSFDSEHPTLSYTAGDPKHAVAYLRRQAALLNQVN